MLVACDMMDTVDGRNPAPNDMENIPSFLGFYTSQVVQDCFHQQYDGYETSENVVALIQCT